MNKEALIKLKSKPIVYIASPYTVGDVAVNVKRQIDFANKLIDLGAVPIVPLYFHFQHLVHPKPYDTWTELDLALLLKCDLLVRLPGESKGADYEELMATKSGINTIRYDDLIKNHPVPDDKLIWTLKAIEAAKKDALSFSDEFGKSFVSEFNMLANDNHGLDDNDRETSRET